MLFRSVNGNTLPMMTARVGGVKINDINLGRQGCEITFVCEERAEVQGLLIWYVV